MKLFLSRLHFPITTLGHGSRMGVWFQGCSIRCPGCVSRDTWAANRGETTVSSVTEVIRPVLADADGVTLSGGEPWDQPEALEALLRWLRPRLRGDILVYSGYPIEQLAPRLAGWDGLIDVLITDPYDRSAGQTLALRGSDNQRVHLLTPLARRRYPGLIVERRDPTARALDVVFDGNTVWMAGIPAPDDLDRLEQMLAAAGFSGRTSADPTAACSPDPAFDARMGAGGSPHEPD